MCAYALRRCSLLQNAGLQSSCMLHCILSSSSPCSRDSLLIQWYVHAQILLGWYSGACLKACQCMQIVCQATASDGTRPPRQLHRTILLAVYRCACVAVELPCFGRSTGAYSSTCSSVSTNSSRGWRMWHRAPRGWLLQRHQLD